MRWSYKTVHYEMKKEGLLGGAFLDESEVELSLNEYGKAGWELVSMLETLDGLIAVFKQPIDLGSQSSYPYSEETEDEDIPCRSRRGAEERRPRPAGGTEDNPAGASEPVAVPIHEDAVTVYRRDKEEQQASPAGDDVGSIRIE
jgi:hypothetical protein